MKHHTPQGSCPPVPHFNIVFWIVCLAAFKKTAISNHNIEVGGCGGKHGISVVSCGWLFFFKEPGITMWGPQTIAKLVYKSNNYGLLYLWL